VTGRSESQLALMTALAEARITEEGPWRFETGGSEHPVVRLARLVGDPTARECERLARALANVSAKEWARCEEGFRDTYLARADLVLGLLADGAMGRLAA
jgi:hypothetical protein